jgi:hypothetical protein
MSEVIVDSFGNKNWYSNGKLHRESGAAIEEVNGNKVWYKHGKQHHEDGPAMEYADGTKIWHLNGLLHRIDGPDVEYKDGDKYWWINGKLHRENGPAVELNNGHREWWIDGKRHRIDGPAVEFADGHKAWWIFHYFYNREQFDEIVNFPDKEIPYISFNNSIYHIMFKDGVGIILSCTLELYIDGRFIRWDWSLGEVILGFVRSSDYIGPLLDWIQENGRYFPSEFIERLYY